MNRFFCDESFREGQELILEKEESHHLVRVMRAQVGDALALINGRGGLAVAEILQANPKKTAVKVVRVEVGGTRSRLRLCFAIPKSGALDFLLKRVTELGVESFQPLLTQNSLSPREWNETRWRKVITVVGKQCEELHFPDLLPPVPLKDWVKSRQSRPLVFCDEAAREAKPGPPPQESGVDLLIGPEGGWSAEERVLLSGEGALTFGLGKNRLRTETAALVATVRTKLWLGEIS